MFKRNIKYQISKIKRRQKKTEKKKQKRLETAIRINRELLNTNYLNRVPGRDDDQIQFRMYFDGTDEEYVAYIEETNTRMRARLAHHFNYQFTFEKPPFEW